MNDGDYGLFLSILKKVVNDYGWVIYAYCLMPNHYHLLIETPKANLAKGMFELNYKYANKFNYFYKKVGHLFAGRYKAILVEKESYLFRLIKYIAQNPVRKRLVKSPSTWRWSSCFEIIKNKRITGCIDREKIMLLFGNMLEYKRFISTGKISENFVRLGIQNKYILGSQSFIASIRNLGARHQNPGAWHQE